MDTARDDAWLIRALGQGDPEAARVFWERYGPILQRIADKHLAPGLRRRVGPETICQSACMSFLRRAQAGEFQLTDGEGLWRLLCAMTLTKIREKARFHHRQKRDINREQFLDAHGLDDSQSGGQQLADHRPSPIEALEFEEEFASIFSDFDEEERRLVELKLQQYTNEEIAVQLGCSERTVRILNRVKERLEKHFQAKRIVKQDSMERLNKFLAHAGVGSRRFCDTLIAAGRVKLDGVAITDLGIKIDPERHQVSVDDHPVRVEKPVYWVVNKPVGYLCTDADPAGRPRAVDLLPHVEQRVFTVGRLDEGSEGLLLMTNDGDLAMPLMHPRYGVPKTYLVLVAGKPTPADLQKLLDGVWLSEGKVKARSVKRIKPQGNSTWLRIVLTEGKNREIRRMLAKLDHKVMKLRRVAIGPVKLDKLPKGKARRVNAEELAGLKEFVKWAQEKIEKARQRASAKPPRDELT